MRSTSLATAIIQLFDFLTWNAGQGAGLSLRSTDDSAPGLSCRCCVLPLQSLWGIKFQISSNYRVADWRCNKQMTYKVPRTPPPELFA